MIAPLTDRPNNSFTIQQIVTSKSDCLALEEQHQIVFLDRGAILHRERDRQTLIGNRHLLLIPAGRGAELRVAALSKLWRISFDNAFLEDPQLFRLGRIQVVQLSEELASRVQLILSQMLAEYKEKNGGYERMIRLQAEELCLLLNRTLPRIQAPELTEKPSTLSEVIGYIQSHYTGEFSLPALPRLCGLTPSYFSRVFKEKTGTPVFEYINRLRVQKACRLLKRTEMSVIEIAFAVGYNNVSFFNRYFRKLNRMSPREYRKYIRR